MLCGDDEGMMVEPLWEIGWRLARSLLGPCIQVAAPQDGPWCWQEEKENFQSFNDNETE